MASPENQPGHWRQHRGLYENDHDTVIFALIAAAIHG
jgi:hypothetical protein